MERDALIEFLIKNVESGCSIGIIDGLGIYQDLDVAWVKATMQRRKKGPRYPSKNASGGLYVLKAASRNMPI